MNYELWTTKFYAYKASRPKQSFPPHNGRSIGRTAQVPVHLLQKMKDARVGLKLNIHCRNIDQLPIFQHHICKPEKPQGFTGPAYSTFSILLASYVPRKPMVLPLQIKKWRLVCKITFTASKCFQNLFENKEKHSYCLHPDALEHVEWSERNTAQLCDPLLEVHCRCRQKNPNYWPVFCRERVIHTWSKDK